MFTENVNLNGYSMTAFAWPFVLQPALESDGTPFERISKSGWIEVDSPAWWQQKANHMQLVRDQFMRDQYFSNSAKQVFFNEKIFKEYHYPQRKDQQFTYVIHVNEKEKYELSISSIDLHMYVEGIGILFINTVNTQYPDIDQIKKINDYGRRIALPFLPQNEKGFILCAEQLGVKSVNAASITDFRKELESYFSSQDGKVTIEQLKQPANFLTDILNCNIGHSCKNQLHAVGSSDDRMYLQCMIRNDELSNILQSSRWKQQGAEEELLYSILFVDPTDATCRDYEMRKMLLEKALYPRWAEYGTIHGITNYSMLAITGRTEWINESVVRPFLVEYGYMLSVVLAQKLGIEKLLTELTNSICKAQKNDEEIENYKNLKWRWKYFKIAVLLSEFSTQDQGIEIYELLKKQMKIDERKDWLDQVIEK